MVVSRYFGFSLVWVKFRIRACIGGRARASFLGSFRGWFWLGPGTRLNP